MSSDLSVDSLSDFYLAPPLNYSDWNNCQITWRDVPEIRSEIERRILDVYNSGNHLLAHQLAILYLEQMEPHHEILQIKSSKRPQPCILYNDSGIPCDQYFREFLDREIHEANTLLYRSGLIKDPPPPLEPISPTHYPTLWAWHTYCLEYEGALSKPDTHSGLKEFWHNHKKAIIIAAVIIVVAATVAVIIVTTAGGGTSLALAGGVGAVQAAVDDYNSLEDPNSTVQTLQGEVSEGIHNFAKAIGGTDVNHSRGPIPIIETNAISSEMTPEILTHLATNWNMNLTATRGAIATNSSTHNGPLFFEDGVMLNGQRYAYWEFLQKSKQEDVFANLLNTLKPVPVVASLPSPTPPASYQPIPPQSGSSLTRSFFEIIGREMLGPEVTAGTLPSNLQTSHFFTTAGTRQPSCRIGGINGMNTSLDYAIGHANYIGGLTAGGSIDWVYNNSHGALGDSLEIFTQNYLGLSPNTANLLTDNWIAFHEENKHNPKAKYLQLCHSQGALHVRNALMTAPKEITDRVIVVAIAPAAIIPKKLCFASYNYASKKDIVPFGELLFAGALDSNEVGVSRTAEETLEHRKELILLDPHPDATGIDHDFRSPTFEKPLTNHLKNHYIRNGEYE